jgi:hypothetical protein
LSIHWFWQLFLGIAIALFLRVTVDIDIELNNIDTALRPQAIENQHYIDQRLTPIAIESSYTSVRFYPTLPPATIVIVTPTPGPAQP